MKAIACDTHGGAEVLRPAARPRPVPARSELLIRVVSAGVARIDAEIREGSMGPLQAPAMPWIPGWSVAGVVEELGEGSGRYRCGDRVWACSKTRELDRGCYAEYVAVAEDAMSPLPNKLLFEEASAIPVHGLAAWQLLFDTLRLKEGMHLLLHGGTGGIGHLALQLCRQRKIQVTTIGKTEDREFVLEYGATEHHESTPDGSFDATLDLRAGKLMDFQLRPDGEQLGLLAGLVDLKQLRPFVRKMLSLKQAADAHRQLESEPGHGVITLNL